AGWLAARICQTFVSIITAYDVFRRIQIASNVPFCDVKPIPCARPEFPSVPGNRACSSFCGSMVDTYVSLSCLKNSIITLAPDKSYSNLGCKDRGIDLQRKVSVRIKLSLPNNFRVLCPNLNYCLHFFSQISNLQFIFTWIS